MNALLVAGAVIALLLHTILALTLTGAFWGAVSAGAALGAWPVVWLGPLIGLVALVVLWFRAARRAGSLGAALGTLASPASAVALFIALTYGAYLMLGPTGITCDGVTTFRPATTPGPGCVTQSGIATVGLVPVPFLVLWSCAPLLAVFGARRSARPVLLVGGAFLLEIATFLPFLPFRASISAPLGLLAGPPLLLALVATLKPSTVRDLRVDERGPRAKKLEE